MSITHGGRARTFSWFIRNDELYIDSESGVHHVYTLGEILEIVRNLQLSFGNDWIPLANNVQKMYEGKEKPGLGMAIMKQRPGDTFHAQGASYLGVVLEEIGVFCWNEKVRGIAWRISDVELDATLMKKMLCDTTGR